MARHYSAEIQKLKKCHILERALSAVACNPSTRINLLYQNRYYYDFNKWSLMELKLLMMFFKN
jgi:hypothetical protein